MQEIQGIEVVTVYLVQKGQHPCWECRGLRYSLVGIVYLVQKDQPMLGTHGMQGIEVQVGGDIVLSAKRSIHDGNTGKLK